MLFVIQNQAAGIGYLLFQLGITGCILNQMIDIFRIHDFIRCVFIDFILRT